MKICTCAGRHVSSSVGGITALNDRTRSSGCLTRMKLRVTFRIFANEKGRVVGSMSFSIYGVFGSRHSTTACFAMCFKK